MKQQIHNQKCYYKAHAGKNCSRIHPLQYKRHCFHRHKNQRKTNSCTGQFFTIYHTGKQTENAYGNPHRAIKSYKAHVFKTIFRRIRIHLVLCKTTSRKRKIHNSNQSHVKSETVQCHSLLRRHMLNICIKQCHKQYIKQHIHYHNGQHNHLIKKNRVLCHLIKANTADDHSHRAQKATQIDGIVVALSRLRKEHKKQYNACKQQAAIFTNNAIG